MQLFDLLRRTFYKESYDLQHRLLNTIMLSGVCGIIGALIFQFIMGYNVIGTVLMLTCLITFLTTLWIANKLKKPQIASVIIAIISNNILLPLLFLYSGGTNSGMPLWCLGGFILAFLLLKGKKTIVVFIINVLGFLTTLMFSIIDPSLVKSMDSQLDVVVDVATSIIFVAIILSSVIRYNNYINEKQRKQILEAMDIANKATKAKSDFISIISHDIRTPMNTIIGFTDIAKANIDNPEKVLDSLEKITLSSNHLVNLMNDILDMSKIEVGKIYVEEENCSLTELISECCQIMQSKIDEKKISIKTDYTMLDEDIVSCDKLRMRQVLINLISNAVKYSPEKGDVEISVIQLTSDDESTLETEIHIKDNGCGMSEEYQKNLFKPFIRDQFAIEKGIEGTGLGLSITKSLVEIMNGTIEVSSKEGQGTEVCITIPFSVPTLSDLEEDVFSENYNFHGVRILLVDDNELHRSIESELLKDVGFTVDEAGDGSTAVQMHVQNNYDLILMDIVMPIMDGYQTVKLIRGLENTVLASTPVVAVTANAYSEDKAKAFVAGMNAYITKPFNKKDMMEVLKLIIKENKIKIQ